MRAFDQLPFFALRERQFDRRWMILAGFAMLAAVIVGIILISRGGGSSDSSTATAGKDGCEKVAAPEPHKESLPAPKQTVRKGEKLTAVVATSCGSFDIALDTTRAPKTTNSFAYLAEEGFYDELTFHRVVPGFVIQGGDPAGTGAGGPGYSVTEKPPPNLTYTKGVVAMAKSAADPPGSSGSQFFVVTSANASLPPEYALLGKISSGMKVVETIDNVPVNGEAPKEPVVIKKVSIEAG